jgi:hypothetical protein
MHALFGHRLRAQRRAVTGLAVTLTLAVPSLVAAQTPGSPATIELSAGTGVGALWDDETMLGRGAPVRVSVGTLVAGRWLLGAEVDWLHHTRDSGYLAADGDLVGVLARAGFVFRDPAARVRPLVGAGFGVVRSTGELRFSSLVPGPDGRPVEGPTDVAPWTLTRPALDLFAAVRIRASDRVAIRPEVGWRATGAGTRPETLETPLVHIRTMVNVDLRLR